MSILRGGPYNPPPGDDSTASPKWRRDEWGDDSTASPKWRWVRGTPGPVGEPEDYPPPSLVVRDTSATVTIDRETARIALAFLEEFTAEMDMRNPRFARRNQWEFVCEQLREALSR